jgi:hypothetical protein
MGLLLLITLSSGLLLPLRDEEYSLLNSRMLLRLDTAAVASMMSLAVAVGNEVLERMLKACITEGGLVKGYGWSLW